MVRVIPRADMSEGWETMRTPSSPEMLSKKEKTSLAVEGGISASTIGGPPWGLKRLQQRLMEGRRFHRATIFASLSK